MPRDRPANPHRLLLAAASSPATPHRRVRSPAHARRLRRASGFPLCVGMTGQGVEVPVRRNDGGMGTRDAPTPGSAATPTEGPHPSPLPHTPRDASATLSMTIPRPLRLAPACCPHAWIPALCGNDGVERVTGAPSNPHPCMRGEGDPAHEQGGQPAINSGHLVADLTSKSTLSFGHLGHLVILSGRPRPASRSE